MRILVTGSAGFLGSNLCQRLLDEGHQVIGIDNFYTGQKENSDMLSMHYNYEFHEHDITGWEFTKAMTSLSPVDQIYHLACPASPPHYQKDPIKTIETCINGTKNVLKWTRLWGCPILLTSTSEIYGDPEVHPQVETYRGNVNTLGPRACYDESKRLAETLMMEYHRLHNVDIRIARIFNTYGPYMDIKDGRVVSNFITQALTNEDITVYGDGKQTRSLCYVDDMVDGLIKLMNSGYKKPVNLGNPDERTILNLANEIKMLTESKSCIVRKELPVDDPTKRCPDITRAKKHLRWEPKIDLKTGLEKTIKYFKKELLNPKYLL